MLLYGLSVPTLVLAAGLGTRLKPLTDELPKPLVPIGDKAAIFHALDRTRGHGPVVVNAHHFQDALTAALAVEPLVQISREAELLGTAGGLAHASSLLGEGDVLVWNADMMTALDADALWAAHAGGHASATLAIRPRERGAGNVGVDDLGRIVRLRGERLGGEERRGGEFLGIHVFGRGLRARLPARGCLVGDVYIPLGRAGAVLNAHETTIPFEDVGSLASYLKANLSWLNTRGLTCMVHTQVPAAVDVGEGVILPAGVTVSGAGRLERIVAWPGASVVAPLCDAVVTPRQVVRVREPVAPPGAR